MQWLFEDSACLCTHTPQLCMYCPTCMGESTYRDHTISVATHILFSTFARLL